MAEQETDEKDQKTSKDDRSEERSRDRSRDRGKDRGGDGNDQTPEERAAIDSYEKFRKWMKRQPEGVLVSGFWRVNQERELKEGGRVRSAIGDMPATLDENDDVDSLPQKLRKEFPILSKQGGRFWLQYLNSEKQIQKGIQVPIVLQPEEEEMDEKDWAEMQEERYERRQTSILEERTRRLEDKLDKIVEKFSDVVTQMGKPKDDGIKEMLFAQIADSKSQVVEAKETRLNEVKMLQMKIDAEKSLVEARIKEKEMDLQKEREALKAEMEHKEKEAKLKAEIEQKKLDAEKERWHEEKKEERERYQQERKEERENIRQEMALRAKEIEARIKEIKEDAKDRLEFMREIGKPKPEDGNYMKALTKAAEANIEAAGSIIKNAQHTSETIMGMAEEFKERAAPATPPPAQQPSTTMGLIEKIGDLLIEEKKTERARYLSGKGQNQEQPAQQEERGNDVLKQLFQGLDPEIIQSMVNSIDLNAPPEVLVPALYTYLGAHNVPLLMAQPYEKVVQTLLSIPNLPISAKAVELLQSQKAKDFWTKLRVAVYEAAVAAKQEQRAASAEAAEENEKSESE